MGGWRGRVRGEREGRPLFSMGPRAFFLLDARVSAFLPHSFPSFCLPSLTAPLPHTRVTMVRPAPPSPPPPPPQGPAGGRGWGGNARFRAGGRLPPSGDRARCRDALPPPPPPARPPSPRTAGMMHVLPVVVGEGEGLARCDGRRVSLRAKEGGPLTLTPSFHPPTPPQAKGEVTLVSSDQQSFTVDVEVAEMSLMIKNTVEGEWWGGGRIRKKKTRSTHKKTLTLFPSSPTQTPASRTPSPCPTCRARSCPR